MMVVKVRELSLLFVWFISCVIDKMVNIMIVCIMEGEVFVSSLYV